MNGRMLGAALVVAGFGLGALADARGGEPGTIVDVARADGRFKTLVAAVEAAGLGGALSGEGPFTVFAPTDAAFAALPAGAVEGLLRDPPALRRVLLHHVARGARPAREVVQYEAVRTLADTTLQIASDGAGVRIGGARVVIADVLARNGVIHVIDHVLLPQAATAAAPTPAPDLLDVAAAAGAFRTLLAAVKAAGLEDALRGPGPFTVFAPTDAAFAALPPGALQALLGDRERLVALLSHHVVSGALGAQEVAGRRSLETLAGTTLRVDARDGVIVGGATVVTPDVRARNGVIHVIDRLLVPPAKDARGAAAPAPPARGTHAIVTPASHEAARERSSRRRASSCGGRGD